MFYTLKDNSQNPVMNTAFEVNYTPLKFYLKIVYMRKDSEM